MRKSAWIIVLFLIGTLYFLSSIPGLRVLPVLSSIHSFMVSLDLSVVRISQWIATQLPLDFGELRYIDTLTRDFLAYARDNPIIIEFFLRKVAHVFIFFVITLALFFLFHQYIKSSAVAVVLSFLGGGVLAFLDELRQSFVDGRTGSMVDVFIDMVGVTLAICLIVFSLFITSGGRSRLFQKDRNEQKEETPPAKHTEEQIIEKKEEQQETQIEIQQEIQKPDAEILITLTKKEDSSQQDNSQ